MNSTDKEIKLASWLIDHTEIETAILFSSYAKGTENIHSDIDLANQLSSGKTIQTGEKLDYLAQLGKFLESDIDLIDLRKAG